MRWSPWRAGVMVGLLSRAVDIAAWAPPWIGLVITPWLALAWLAGAATARPGRMGRWSGWWPWRPPCPPTWSSPGAMPDRCGWCWRPVALMAGPPMAGPAPPGAPRDPLGCAGLALLGAALAVEGITLQFGDRVVPARIGFGAGDAARAGDRGGRGQAPGVDPGPRPLSFARARRSARPDGEALCDFALQVLDETDAIALRHLAGGLNVRAKADATLVTQVDTEIEELLRARIAERYPAHGVLGEELGTEPGRRARRAGSSTHRRDPQPGARHPRLRHPAGRGARRASWWPPPSRHPRWRAAGGRGAAGGARVRDLLGERPHPRIERASGWRTRSWSGPAYAPWTQAGRSETLRAFAVAAWRDRGFGDFWGYMLVAEGAADAMLEVGPTLWDLAAPALIVRGGRRHA